MLQDSSGERKATSAVPTTTQPQLQYAASGNSGLPTAEELRELVQLMTELNRIYRDVAATQPTETGAAQPQQP